MEHAVVIAGGGPTGLMLAAELRLAGVDAVIVERRAEQVVDGSRAGGLLSRSLEMLDQRGIAERFVDAGTVHTMYGFGGMPFDIGDLPTRFSYVLALRQSVFEPMFAEWVLRELGAPILRNREVVGFAQDADGVDVQISDGTTVRARYLVGCDGGRSIVRKLAGIDFVGLDASTSWMIAEATMDQKPETGFVHNEFGSHALNSTRPDGVVGVVLTEREVDHDREPTLEDLRALLVDIYGTDYGLRGVTWLSRFTDATRQAAAYRAGRVFVAGDAAHVHPPQGGQGMGTGLQDAANLGWKLARVVHGHAPDALLDTYHSERSPVAARVLQNTQTQVVLARPDARHQATRAIVTGLTDIREVRHRLYAMLAALDLRYDCGDGHPLVGRRMPDLDLRVGGDPTRVYALLRDAQPVLLSFGGVTPPDVGVPVVVATADHTCELPIVGTVDVPPAVLIRPDGYVAWAGDVDDASLADAVTRWFGA